MPARDHRGRYMPDDGIDWRNVATLVGDLRKAASPRRFDVLAKEGFTEEGCAQVEEFAAVHAITDPHEARAAYEKAFPPPEAAQTSGSRWDFLHPPPVPDGPPVEELLAGAGAEEKWLAKTISRTLRQVRGEQDDSAPLHLLTAGFGR
jgi:hypothetical protein